MKKHQIYDELEMIESEKNSVEKVDKLFLLGKSTWNSGMYDETLRIMTLMFSIAEDISYTKGTAQSLNALGLISKDSKKSLEYFFKSYTQYLRLKDSNGLASTLNNIGIIYKDIASYDKAIEYFMKSLEYIKDGDQSGIKAPCLNNLGMIFFQKGLYDEALDYLLQAKEIWHDKEMFVNYPNNLLNIAHVYIKRLDNESATMYIEEAERINNKINNNDIQTYLYYLKALVMDQLSFPESSIKYLHKALSLYKEEFKLISKKLIVDAMIEIYYKIDDLENVIYWQRQLIIDLEEKVRLLQEELFKSIM